MRVAFVSYDFGEYSIRHANALRAGGEVLLILPRTEADPHLPFLDPHVDFRPFHKPRLRQPWRQLPLIRWILRQIRSFEPDVIHLQAGHLWFNLALPLLRRYPLVLTAHDPRHHLGDWGSRNTPQWVMDFGCRRADRVIVHGRQLKDVVSTEVGVPRDRIHVIPHIAVGTRPVAQRVAAEPGLILFFGRIWAYKGLDYLIRAQPLINRVIPEARTLIAGVGEDFTRYERIMEDPSRFIVENRWISDDERARMFQRASVVVLPYVEATQSGIVPVAYTFARPVVATRTGGLPDVVEDGRTGFLVPPRDSDALAQAIITMLQDDERRQRMGMAGRQKLESEWNPAVIAAQTAEVYRHAIEDHERGRHPDRRPLSAGTRTPQE